MAVTCRNIRELHDAFIDGELSPSMTAEVHAHLLQCPECQQQVQMLRAVGDVIAQDDHSAPRLSHDFAAKVVGAMPEAVPVSTRTVDSRDLRRLTWRGWASMGLSAAAVLFLSIAFWPKEDLKKPTMVAGISAVKSVVDPTISAVQDTQKTASSIKGLLEITVDQARQDVRNRMQKAHGDLSITRILLQPFDELLTPTVPTKEPAENAEQVRF